MDMTDKYIGRMLDNRYEILEKIGSGGMAVVYKARCHRLNRLVAIKILKDELAGDAEFRRRFHSESQAVAMLSHPNIVAVYDVARSGDVEYIVMELIEGITLKQYINRKGVLNWKEALHFSTQVCKALSHAHSRGIIHRDIKPHNIMICKDGSVKVADFGIARLQSTQNTLTQEALGSVHYISPEQAKGGQVDARSDLYSLGVVMYEMLTGHLPFEGDSAVSVAIQHISAIPLMPRDINPDIPRGLEAITMRAMEPDLNIRYASADEMLHDLEEFRKNPAIEFNYPGVLNARGGAEPTRAVPTSAIARAEHNLPKPVRTPRRELSKEEYVKSNRRASRTAGLIGIFAIIVFLIFIFVFMWNYYLKDMIFPQEETVTIPRFIGQTYDSISKNPDYAKYYTFSVTEEFDEAEPGTVIAQSPQPDRTRVVPATGLIEIELTVSKGAEPNITMPNLINIDYREAQVQLANMNLNLDIKLEGKYNKDVTKDFVIATIPGPGEPLGKGGIVYITYSLGPEIKMTEVPDCTGEILTAAIIRLEGYKLGYEIVREHSPNVAKDVVISQDLVPGTKVEEGTVVVLIVSDGPVEPVTPTPDEEPYIPAGPTIPETASPEPTETPEPSLPFGAVLPQYAR